MAVDFIPEKFYVARQPRGNSDEVLGFMVSMNKDGYSSRKATADRWAKGGRGTVQLDPIEVLNVPLTGFSLTENKRRMMNKNVIWRCIHPEGFEFEITSDNFSDFLMEIDMKQGIIQTEMIFVRRAGENYLTWVGSEAHKAAVSQDTAETKISVKDIQTGDKFTFKNGSKGEYIGSFHAIGMPDHIYHSHRKNETPTNIDEKSTKQHFYYNLDDNGKRTNIDNKSSLTVVSVDTRLEKIPTVDETYDMLLAEIRKPHTKLSIKNSIIVHIEHKPFKRTDLKTTLVEYTYTDITDVLTQDYYYQAPGHVIVTLKNVAGYFSPAARYEYNYGSHTSRNKNYTLKYITAVPTHKVELAEGEFVYAYSFSYGLPYDMSRYSSWHRPSESWRMNMSNDVQPSDIDKVYIQMFERV